MTAASDEHAGEAAAAVLRRGNAVDAVVAGVLAAAARHPGVLLGPLQLVVAGSGAGRSAVDGRVQQPGRGVPRPRGFLPSESIPEAAFVAAPALPAALAAAIATFGSVPFARALGPAVELARACAPGRGAVFERMTRRGPLLASAPLGEELLAAAGRLQGGLLGLHDLTDVRPAVTRCAEDRRGDRLIATVPWGSEAVRGDTTEEPHPELHPERVQVVAALDGRGLAAVACYETAEKGLTLPGAELVAPFAAQPVRRGVPRVRPGTPLPAAAPIAVVEEHERVELVVGVAAAREAERLLGAWLEGRTAPGEVHLVGVAGGTSARRLP